VVWAIKERSARSGAGRKEGEKETDITLPNYRRKLLGRERNESFRGPAIPAASNRGSGEDGVLHKKAFKGGLAGKCPPAVEKET